MPIEIREVTNKSLLKKFVKFNIELYKNHKYHVPGLISDEINTLSSEKNPAFEFCEAIYFLAYKGGKIVGRIAGIINHRANEIWEQKYARFSFCDFIDDEEVSKSLFDAIEKWAKEKGMNGVQGPLGFTDLDHEGLLTKGFDLISTFSTSYNYPYYEKHILGLGFGQDQDWHEFLIHLPEETPERFVRIAPIVMQKQGLKILKFKKVKEVMPYARKIFELWNEAYRPLYGYSELTSKQIDYYVKMYIPMIRLELLTVVVKEEDNSIVGIGLAMPSLSKGLQKAKGSLFPFGWIHLLKALYGKNDVVDLYIIGIHPDYQGKGVNALMFYDLMPLFKKNGYKFAESNPELETNTKMQSQWELFDAPHVRTRRAFLKHI